MKPIERSAIATMPASTPGPRMVTSSSAQISELIERDETMISSAIGRTNTTLGVVLRAAQEGDRHRDDDRQQRAERRDIEGVPERPPQLVQM